MAGFALFPKVRFSVLDFICSSIFLDVIQVGVSTHCYGPERKVWDPDIFKRLFQISRLIPIGVTCVQDLLR